MTRSVDLRLDPERASFVVLGRSNLKRRTKATKQDRLQIPVDGVRCVGEWLEDNTSVKVLIELAESGCIIVRPWSPYGEEVLDQLGNLNLEDGIDASNRGLIVGIGVSFLPSTIDTSCRLTFYEPMLALLGIPAGESPELYVLCSADRIEIWNETYHTEVRKLTAQKLIEFFPWVGRQY